MKFWRRTGVAGWMWICIAPYAQVVRVGPVAVRPNATAGNSLTIFCSPSSTSFNLVHGGSAVAASSIAVTTTWAGDSQTSSLQLYAYFVNPASALSGGTPVASIPSSAVFGQMPTGVPVSYTAFTQTGTLGTAGGSLLLLNLGALGGLSGSRTDELSLKIDLSGLPQLPAAVYSGTLFLQAQEL